MCIHHLPIFPKWLVSRYPSNSKSVFKPPTHFFRRKDVDEKYATKYADFQYPEREQHSQLLSISPFGVKGTVRTLTGIAPEYRFVARFDVARYYDSMDHSVLLALLAREDPSERLFAIVSEYLARPDMRRTGRGMVAGGSLSPLLGALYLKPLDDAIERLVASGKIFYVRYMDDFVLLARTRWHLREAIATVYRVMKELKLCLHREKRFVGKIGGGFSFLGYRVHPGRKLRPSTEGVRRMTTRFRRLYEQGATGTRLWEYVSRWTRWLWGGLDGLVSRKGGIRRYYFGVIKRLRIVGLYRPVESVGPAHPLL